MTQEFYCGIENDFTKPVDTGIGTSVVVSGWFYHESKIVKSIEILVQDVSFRAMSIRGVRFDVLEYQASRNLNKISNSLDSGFWAVINLPEVMIECELPIKLKATLNDGDICYVELGSIKLIPLKLNPVQVPSNQDSQIQPLIAICMATYNPRIDLFKKQINSIIEQTYNNWICIINDDCSPISVYKEMEHILSEDDRFILFRNSNNLGFYHNFEKCLTCVPDEAEFVALSDQDDYWYPMKLEECLSTFDEETSLVYSDMHLIDEKGEILSNTYWTTRKNNYTDLDFLILANTVTGAASVFRANLLKKALPFPQKIGDSYHDWWIALCALMDSKIKYVDRPLYGYCQHGNNVIGHAGKESIIKKTRLFNTISIKNNLRELKRLLKHALLVFNFDYKRIILVANTLTIRFANTSKSKLKKAKYYSKVNSITSMLLLMIRGKILRRDTLNAEFRLFASVFANKFLNPMYQKRKNLYAANVGKPIQISSSNIFESTSILTVEPLLQKIAPMKLNIADYFPLRINILIPTIDFKYFFGGYLGKFNLAKKLAGQGFSVRFIIVDYCDFNVAHWKEEIKKYNGLENIFDIVEVECVFDRSKSVDVNKDDILIATTWWTAYIANDSISQMNKPKFIYLIQEYEPLTFPHGAYYALADATYDFDHFGIFSSELLRDYFRQKKLGVYKNTTSQIGDDNSDSFQNAILSFDIDPEIMKNKKKKSFLFYARPEPHASRNMFEMGVMALSKALESDLLDLTDWEFFGMGTVGQYQEIKLTEQIKMKLLPKMNLEEYQDVLPNFDVGLSLMYTPHPSLVPLEMAAAGMFVITNSYENKDEVRLQEISTNLIVAEPTIESIQQKIIYSMKKVNEFDQRIGGSNVSWSSDWQKTFNEVIMGKIANFIRNINN